MQQLVPDQSPRSLTSRPLFRPRSACPFRVGERSAVVLREEPHPRQGDISRPVEELFESCARVEIERPRCIHQLHECDVDQLLASGCGLRRAIRTARRECAFAPRDGARHRRHAVTPSRAQREHAPVDRIATCRAPSTDTVNEAHRPEERGALAALIGSGSRAGIRASHFPHSATRSARGVLGC